MKKYYYEDYKKQADFILDKIDFKPEIAIVLGTALGALAEEIEDSIIIKYSEIPGFLTSTVSSHAGEMVIGRIAGKKVICMSGRFHYYEGYEFEDLAMPVRLFHVLGVKTLILTNAAGAVNPNFSVGDIMVIEDQIKIMGASPVRGDTYEGFGPRFFPMCEAYTPELRELSKKCADRLGITLREGVYFYWPGPHFESPAEIRLIAKLGGDAVGMSTAPETICAAQCSMKVLGFSLLTNMAAGVVPGVVAIDDVDGVGRDNSEKFKSLLREVIGSM